MTPAPRAGRDRAGAWCRCTAGPRRAWGPPAATRDHGGSRRGGDRPCRAGDEGHPRGGSVFIPFGTTRRRVPPHHPALDPFADRELKYCAVKLMEGRHPRAARGAAGGSPSRDRRRLGRLSGAARVGAAGWSGPDSPSRSWPIPKGKTADYLRLQVRPRRRASSPQRGVDRATPFQETAWFRGIAAGGAAGASPMLEDWSQCATERAGRIGFASPIRGAVRFKIDALWPGHGFGAQALRCSSPTRRASGTKRCCCARGRPGRPRALPPLRLRGTCEVSEGEHVMRTSVL